MSSSENDPALERLLDQREAFKRFLQGRLGDADLAEDLLQESLARAIEKLGDLRETEAVVPWFYRLLRNAIVDRARRAGAEERRLATYARDLEAAKGADEAHQREVCACVTALVETLKPEYEAVLTQVDLNQVPLSDFAASAGITPNNAGVRLHRARQALLRQTRAFCRACAEHGCLDCTCARPPE